MKEFIKRLNKIEIINFYYLIFLLLLSLIIFIKGNNPFISNNFIIYTFLLILILYIALNKERFRKSNIRIIHYMFTTKLYNLIYFVVFVPLIFGSFKDIVPYFFKPADMYLAKIDSFLLGGFNLFKYLEIHLNFGWLNTGLQVIYIIYFFLPIIIVTVHYFQKDYNQIEEDIFYVTLGLYMCYIGYILVPAYGPRFFYTFSKPMAGGDFFIFFNTLLTKMEENKLDVFPSAHIEMSLFIVYLVRKNRVLFPLFIIEFVGIIAATIILRYHYVTDIIAGVIFFIITYYLGRFIEKKYDALAIKKK